MKNTLNLLLTGLVIIQLTACAEETVESPEAQYIKVKIQPLSELVVPFAFSAPATTLSENTSALQAEISARIEHIPVKVGDVISKGTLLVELNCRDANAQVAQEKAMVNAAEAQLSLSKTQLDRAKTLREKKSISVETLNQRQADHVSTKANLESSKARLTLAKLSRSRCKINAPFDGVVSAKQGQVGELASPGAPMITLVSTENLELSADLTPDQAWLIDGVDDLVFETAYSRYPVSKRAVTAVIDPLAKTREARLRFKDSSPLPGTPGRLKWNSNEKGLPPHWFTERDNSLGVMLYEDGKVQFHPLPNAQAGRASLVNLPLTTTIVTAGRHRVNDGDTVNAVTK